MASDPVGQKAKDMLRQLSHGQDMISNEWVYSSASRRRELAKLMEANKKKVRALNKLVKWQTE